MFYIFRNRSVVRPSAGSASFVFSGGCVASFSPVDFLLFSVWERPATAGFLMLNGLVSPALIPMAFCDSFKVCISSSFWLCFEVSLIFVPKKKVEFSFTGLGARTLKDTSPYLSFMSLESFWTMGVEPSIEDGSDWYLLGCMGLLDLPSSTFKDGRCRFRKELPGASLSCWLFTFSSVLNMTCLFLDYWSRFITSTKSVLMFYVCDYSMEFRSMFYSPILSEILLWMNLFWKRSEVPPPVVADFSAFDIFDWRWLVVYLPGVVEDSYWYYYDYYCPR